MHPVVLGSHRVRRRRAQHVPHVCERGQTRTLQHYEVVEAEDGVGDHGTREVSPRNLSSVFSGQEDRVVDRSHSDEDVLHPVRLHLQRYWFGND